MKLTRLALRKLEPGQHLTAGGIRFDRLLNGDGRYTVELMVDRVRIHRVVGLESEGVTLTQAEHLIAQLRADARRERWGMVQQHATRMIRAVEVVRNLQTEPIGSTPTTESHARPLTRLEPESDARLLSGGGGLPETA